MASDANKVSGRVLVIDDDRSARVLLERVLTKAGHQVTLVDSAEEALARLAAAPYDVLVTDKNLPGADGFELVRRARQHSPRLRTILMTGFPSPETRAIASELGVYSYLVKPFGVHDVLELCEGAVRAAKEGPP